MTAGAAAEDPYPMPGPTHGPEEAEVVRTMQAHAFTFGSAPRTYRDIHFGYGLEAAFICLVAAVVFWLLAGAASPDAALVRSIAVVRLRQRGALRDADALFRVSVTDGVRRGHRDGPDGRGRPGLTGPM
jgi:hypothetical protein